MIGHFTDDERVLQFINSNDLDRLAPMGTSCPDHFLRTKIQPLVIHFDEEIDFENVAMVRDFIEPFFGQYRKEYVVYYDTCKKQNSPSLRDQNPVII